MHSSLWPIHLYLVLLLTACGGGGGGGGGSDAEYKNLQAPGEANVAAVPLPADDDAASAAPVPGGGGAAPAVPIPGDDAVPAVPIPGDDQVAPIIDDLLDMVAEPEFDPHWSDTGVFSAASGCSDCHRASADGSVMRLPHTAQGIDISPATGWRHSMMAHAWNDPYFQATVEDQATEFADYAGDIEDKCLSCHSPMAHTTAHASGQDLTADDCSLGGECYRMASAELQQHAREGVSCTLCHQLLEGETEPGSGNYKVAAATDDDARIIYGPFENPRTRPMQNNTQYRVSYGEHISRSEHCASCHELDTPSFDVNTGHPLQPAVLFREQATYSEWRNSRYADGGSDDRSCQDCHMPQPADYGTQIAVARSGASNPAWPQRAPFSRHDMAGGNTYVLGLLKTWREQLGIANSTTAAGFDQAIADSRDMLGRAATVTLTHAAFSEGQVELDVQIVNHTGHKLPSAYPSRRMWLQLTARNASGAVLFTSGAADARGYLAIDARDLEPSCLAVTKADGFDSAACFEPHRDTITRSGQVAVYESVMADSNRHITYNLLYSTAYLKDNRIPPAGFSSTGASYDPASGSVGLGVDSDFNRALGAQGSGSDTVHYRFALPQSESGPVSIDLKLWYQSIRPAFIAAMPHRGEKSDRMRTMYRQQPPLAELLDQQSLVLQP